VGHVSAYRGLLRLPWSRRAHPSDWTVRTYVLFPAFCGCNRSLVNFIVFFRYGLGLLKVEDFKRLDWGILMLLGGGSSLGDAVKSSGLLKTVANGVVDIFGDSANASQVDSLKNACFDSKHSFFLENYSHNYGESSCSSTLSSCFRQILFLTQLQP
jgi:hypothetical protein